MTEGDSGKKQKKNILQKILSIKYEEHGEASRQHCCKLFIKGPSYMGETVKAMPQMYL